MKNGIFLAIAAWLGLFGSADAQSSSTKKPSKSRSIDELLLFFPAKYPAGDWSPQNLQFQDIDFTSADQTKLHGWYCPCENPRAVILMTHGNGGNITSRASWVQYLQKHAKVSVFIFDYRGFGRSTGKPTVEGVLQDSMAARAKLCELASVKDSEMLLMGESLGGAIAVQLAAKSAPRGLILQSTFSSLKDVAKVHYPSLAWLVPADRLDSASAIKRYQGPLLQSHGDEDPIVPFASGEKLFDAANEPKSLLTISKAGHNNWLTEEYLIRLDQFLKGLEKPAAKK